MSTEITVVLRWLNGDSMKIHTSPTSTPTTLLERAQAKPCPHGLLMHEGRLLNSWLSIASQGVKQGDTLIVYELKVAQPPSNRITSFEAKTESILFEVLKINDAQYYPLEICRDGTQEYQRLQKLVDVGRWDEFTVAPEFPVIGKPHLSTDALPVPIDDEGTDEEDDSDESDELKFTTIEQAAKFLSKHPFQRWAW
jgi:hypothetical protein